MSASDSSPPPSPSSSTSSVDSEDQDISFNKRISPSWKTYQSLFERRGYHLDTAYDVRLYYERVFPGGIIPDSPAAVCQRKAYRRACELRDDELCRDEGLPETLFRGTCKRSKKRIVVKAVGLYSRQYAIIRLLSSKPLRDDPMNHTIPVVDLIEVPESQLAFIVQEEWSSEIIDTENPCPLPSFLRALHQCIEGLVFMHAHGVAHLDISLRNILTDFEGHYAYIDFETSRLYPYWNDDRSREVSRYDDKGTTKSKRENHLGENMPYSNSAQNDSQRSLYPQLRLRSHIYSSSSSSSASSSPSSSLSPSPNPSFISSNSSSLVDLVPSYPLNIPKKVHGQHNQTRPADKPPDNSITSGFDGRRNKFPSPPRTVVHCWGYLGSEMPPELDECGTNEEYTKQKNKIFDPFKVDVWALSVVILRACKLCGYDDPEFVMITQRGLISDWRERASALELLKTFERLAPRLIQGKIGKP